MLFVTSSLGPGGTERVVSTIANALLVDLNQIEIVAINNRGKQPFFKLDQRIQFSDLMLMRERFKFTPKFVRFFLRIGELRKTIRDRDPDCVIAFGDTTNILTLLATLFTRIPVIISERTVPQQAEIGFAWRVLRFALYRFAAALVLQSERIAPYFANYAVNTVVIPNPVLTPDARVADKRGEDQKLIVAAGRLSPEKGFPLLIKSFRLISENFPDWKLRIVGSGVQEQQLRYLIESQGLAQAVQIVPTSSDLASEIAQASFLVSPSLVEGFPMVVCEAMALGIPVVATRSGGAIEDIIVDSINGVLVEAGDVQALTQGISWMIANQERRIELGAEARNITIKFGLPVVLSTWKALLKKVCG